MTFVTAEAFQDTLARYTHTLQDDNQQQQQQQQQLLCSLSETGEEFTRHIGTKFSSFSKMSLLTAVTLFGLTSNSQSLTVSSTIRRTHGLQPRSLFSSSSSSASNTRLFVGDFSSHPYSTYYGTSGSTAQQNLSQNDEMADMYGYRGPPGMDPMYAEYYGGVNTHLDSMQGGLRPPNMRDAMREGLMPPPGAGPLRRGDFRPGLPPPPPELLNNDMMDRVQERHMLDRLDELLYEHDTLRQRLDRMEDRVEENQRLQQEQTDNILNAVSQEHVESTKQMMENVLMELRNVQASLNMVQGTRGNNNGPASPGPAPPSSNFGAPGGYSPPPSPASPATTQPPPPSPQQSSATTTTTSAPPSPQTSYPQASQSYAPPPPSQAVQSPPPPPPPKPQINTTPPTQMKTGMGAENTNPQNPTYYNQGPPPPPPPHDHYHDDDDHDHDPMNAMNSFQQRAVGMRQPPPPPPRPTEPRRSLLRERIYEQKGRGENEMPYGPTAGGLPPPPPPSPPGGLPPQGGGTPGFTTQGSVRSMNGGGGGFGGRQPPSRSPPPPPPQQQQQQQQRGPPINGGYASGGPPPGYFQDDDDDEGAESIWPKGGVNTFEPGQGPGQQQRSYERSANRGATRSNSFGNFGGQQNHRSSGSSGSVGGGGTGRGRMSGFGNGMGMGRGSGRSGGSTRSFGEESGSMTFTDGPDGGRCFLT